MNASAHTSTADVADRHRLYFALAMFAVGLIYLGKAIAPWIHGPASDLLNYAVYALGISTIGVLIPSVITKIRLPRNERIVYFSDDGYVADLVRRSFKVSWATTFITLTICEIVFDSVLSKFEALFIIRITLFIMLTVMSMTFILLNWSANKEFPGDET